MTDHGDRPDRQSSKPLFTSRRRRTPGERRERRGFPIIGYAILLAVAGIFGWIWQSSRDSDATGPSEIEAATPAAEEPAAEGEAEVPELDMSDAFVRRLAAGVSSHPEFASWLVTDDLARRFVITVVEIAHGRSPTEHLRFMAPAERFEPATADGRMVIDPESYRRYDLLTEAFTSLDTEGAAEAYRRLEPLFERAYRELGLPERSFDETLRLAIDRMLEVEVPESELEVVPDGAVYGFADPEMQELTEAEKHLIRMGPENARRVQEKLRELSRVLEESGAARDSGGGPLPSGGRVTPAAARTG